MSLSQKTKNRVIAPRFYHMGNCVEQIKTVRKGFLANIAMVFKQVPV